MDRFDELFDPKARALKQVPLNQKLRAIADELDSILPSGELSAPFLSKFRNLNRTEVGKLSEYFNALAEANLMYARILTEVAEQVE
jgi:hypothetical protein